MDSEKAHLFNLQATGIVKSRLERKKGDHHTHNKKDHGSDPGAEHFYVELALTLKDASEILLMGPGLSKNHFKAHLEKHHGAALAKKIVGVEASDHPSDNQILATARKFFATYNLFNEPIKPG
jgi:stalled ribosome rescue protein Dom34